MPIIDASFIKRISGASDTKAAQIERTFSRAAARRAAAGRAAATADGAHGPAVQPHHTEAHALLLTRAGAIQVGPNGGRYKVLPDGSKSYLPKE